LRLQWRDCVTIKVRFKSKKKRNVWLNTRFEMIRQIKEHIEMCNRITGKKTRAYFKIENDTFLLSPLQSQILYY
jgi:hypothetical protein